MTDPQKTENEKKPLLPVSVNVTWTTVLVFLGIITTIATAAFFIGRFVFDKEKADYYDEIKNLKSIIASKADSLEKINKQLFECNAAVNYLKNNNPPPGDTIIKNETIEKKAPARKPKKKVTHSKPNTTTKPKPKTEIPDERISQLQARLQYFEDQNQGLIDENDDLKSKISLMKQKLQRARDIEKKRNLEADNAKKSAMGKQRDDIISSVEKTMEGLVPDIPIASSKPIATEPIKAAEKLPDYIKLGDDDYNKANELEQTLINQPDSYFIGLIPNKTKNDFIQMALKGYYSALSNYQQSGNSDKIELSENKIKAFKKQFKLK